MTYKVSVSGITSSYSVVIKKNQFRVAQETQMTRLQDLSDVNTVGVEDSYLLAYDSVTQTYKTVNPDEILSAAVNDPNSVGIPTVFINQIGIDLDNKIDLDAGTF